MVVSAMRPSATLGEVQMKAFGKPNALAIYTVVILLFLNLLYGESTASKLLPSHSYLNGAMLSIFSPFL
jgi:hypothetical protein